MSYGGRGIKAKALSYGQAAPLVTQTFRPDTHRAALAYPRPLVVYDLDSAAVRERIGSSSIASTEGGWTCLRLQ